MKDEREMIERIEMYKYNCGDVYSVFSLLPLLRAHYIILLVESVLFGVFVMVIFYDQVWSSLG